MIVTNEIWGEIPLIHVYDETMNQDTPTVFMLHGHTSASEHNLHYAYHLANKGVRVLLPDAYLHGKRAQGSTMLELNMRFWDIVMNSVKELYDLYEYGLKRRVFQADNIGLIGSSMGGITTSAALATYPWIKAAGICMGVTSLTKLAKYQVESLKIGGQPLPFSSEQKEAIYQQLAPFDLENKKEVFTETPIIFWHGDQDPIVPIECSYPFYEKYLQQTKTVYLKEKGAGHAVSRIGILKVTDFVAQHLSE